jgi:hypothetical protein
MPVDKSLLHACHEQSSTADMICRRRVVEVEKDVMEMSRSFYLVMNPIPDVVIFVLKEWK